MGGQALTKNSDNSEQLFPIPEKWVKTYLTI